MARIRRLNPTRLALAVLLAVTDTAVRAGRRHDDAGNVVTDNLALMVVGAAVVIGIIYALMKVFANDVLQHIQNQVLG